MDSRRRRLSRLYLKKHFRRSLKHDYVERTVPNESISIISISSTDAESFNKNDWDSDMEIISPSPDKNVNTPCLRTKMLKRISSKITRQCENTDELNENDNSGIFKDLSFLHYDKFKTPLNAPNDLVNSTMLCIGEAETHQIERNSVFQDASESMNESLENLLDNIYGDSWRPFKEKVLPKSERKVPRKKLILKQMPATERKMKNDEILTGLNGANKKLEIKNNSAMKKIETNNHSLLNSDLEHYKALDKSGSDKENSLEENSSQQFPRRKLFSTENVHKNSKDLCSVNEQMKYSLKNTIGLRKDEVGCSNKCDEEISQRQFPEDSCSVPNSDQKAFRNSIEIRPTLGDKASSPDDDSLRNVWTNSTRKKTKKRHLRKFFDSLSSKSDEDNLESKENDEANRKTHKTTTESNCVDELLEKYLNFPLVTDELNDNEVEEKEYGIRKIHTKTEKRRDKKNTRSKPKPKGIETNNCISSEGSNELNNLGEKNDKKRNKKTKTRKQKLIDFSDSDDASIVNGFKELNLKNNESRTCSFLASLSKNIPDSECDPSARIYKVNFKNTKEELARKLFVLYNKEIFDNRIPQEMPLQWNARMLRTAGYCYSKKTIHRDGKTDLAVWIVLSSKVLTTADRLRDTLIHEMCHAATWIIDGVKDGHGKYWKAWAKKAKTTFPELPPIKTCHNYELNSKYVYKCSDCGYSIKRHRKSLDIERKRCGYCLGKFELFINKVNKKGEQNLIPADTPKKPPTGFALFVQENYSKYKSMGSAAAMKQLSKDFKEIKLN